MLCPRIPKLSPGTTMDDFQHFLGLPHIHAREGPGPALHTGPISPSVQGGQGHPGEWP